MRDHVAGIGSSRDLSWRRGCLPSRSSNGAMSAGWGFVPETRSEASWIVPERPGRLPRQWTSTSALPPSPRLWWTSWWTTFDDAHLPRLANRSRERSERSAKVGGERGFEPSVEFPLHTLSKRAQSTTLTSLRLESMSCSRLGRLSHTPVPRVRFLRTRLDSAGSTNSTLVERANCVRPLNEPRSLTAICSRWRPVLRPGYAWSPGDAPL